jgi:hypothetical protein
VWVALAIGLVGQCIHHIPLANHGTLLIAILLIMAPQAQGEPQL